MSWSLVKLGELCTKITDGSHNPPKGVETSDFMMLSSKNVFNDNINCENPRYLTQEDFERENKRTDVSANDILLTIVGTIGRAAVVPADFPKVTLQRSVAVFKPDMNLVHPRFLMYSLQNILDVLTKGARGVAQKGIYLKSLREIEVLLPPLNEQKRITAILDKANALRRKREKAIALTDDLLQSVFLDMFGDPVTNQKGFNTVSFESICERIFKGAFDLKKDLYRDEGTPFLRISNIQDGTIDLSNAAYVEEETYNKYEKSSLVSGDIIFSKVGTIDRIALIPDNIEKCVISQNNVGAKLKVDVISNIYLLHYLLTPSILKLIKSKSKKAVQDKLVLSDLRALPILIPPKKLQSEYEKRFADILVSKEKMQRAFTNSNALFSSLTQQAFRGDLTSLKEAA